MFKRVARFIAKRIKPTKNKWLFSTWITALFVSPILLFPAITHAVWWTPWTWGQDIKAGLDNITGDIPATILKPMVDFVWSSIANIFTFINQWLITVINTIIGPIMEEIFGRGDSDVGLVKDLWDIALGVANVTFFLALLVFSLLIIFRYSGYNFKKAISSLVIVAFLANISYTLSIIIIFDIGGALTNIAQNLFGYGINDLQTFLGEDLNGAFAAFDFRGVAEVNNDVIYTDLLGPIATGLTAILFAFVLAKLAFVLIERVVRLTYLTFVAPVMFALSLFPAKSLQDLAKQWWEDMFKWTMVLPIAFVLISVAMKFFYTYVGEMNFATALVTPVITDMANSPDGGASLGVGVIMLILSVSFIIAAGSAPKMAGAALSAITESGGNMLENTTKSVGKWALNKGKQGVGWADKKIRTAAGEKALDIGARTGLGKYIQKRAGLAKGKRIAKEKAREIMVSGYVNEQMLRQHSNNQKDYKRDVNREIRGVLSVEIKDLTHAKKDDLVKAIKEGRDSDVKNLAKEMGLGDRFAKIKTEAEARVDKTAVGARKNESQAGIFGALNKLISDAYNDQDQTVTNVRKKMNEAIKILEDEKSSSADKSTAALELNTWYGVLDKMSKKHPNKEIREEAKAEKNAFGMEEQARGEDKAALQLSGFPFGEAPKFKNTSSLAMSDDDIIDLVEGRQRVEFLENIYDSQRKSIRAGGNPVMTQVTDIIDAMEPEDLEHTKKVLALNDISKMALNRLAGTGTLSKVATMLSTSDIQIIEEIKTGSSTTKTADVQAYLGRVAASKGVTINAIELGNVARLVATNGLDTKKLAQAQSVTGNISTDAEKNQTNNLINLKINQTNIQNIVNDLDQSISSQTQSTSGYEQAMKSGITSGAVDETRMAEIAELKKEFEKALADNRPSGSDASTGMKTFLKTGQLNELFKAFKDTGANYFLRSDKVVKSAADLGDISGRVGLEALNKLPNTYAKVKRTDTRDS